MLKTLRSYIFWTYDRGSFHYDVMVTLILLFIFVSPRFINFHDRPVYNLPSQIMVQNDGAGSITYEVKQSDVDQSLQHVTATDPDKRMTKALRRLIEPIAGDMLVERYEPIQDATGQTVAYRVWAHR